MIYFLIWNIFFVALIILFNMGASKLNNHCSGSCEQGREDCNCQD